jgi:glycerol uptake facilitator-like aquaporin
MVNEEDQIVTARAPPRRRPSAPAPPADPPSPFPDDTRDKGALFRACLAEFLAMTMFVFLGCGSVTATGEFLVDEKDFSIKVNVARVLPIATCFGISITVLAFNIGAISGGHINPAVTYALMLQRKVSPARMILYFIAQFSGSLLGASILWAGLSGATWNPSPGVNMTAGFRLGIDQIPAVGKPPFYLGANQLNPVLSTSNGLLLEVMGTSFLVGTVMATAVDGRAMGNVGSLAPIPIGISVWIAHLVLIPWTGK